MSTHAAHADICRYRLVETIVFCERWHYGMKNKLCNTYGALQGAVHKLCLARKMHIIYGLRRLARRRKRCIIHYPTFFQDAKNKNNMV